MSKKLLGVDIFILKKDGLPVIEGSLGQLKQILISNRGTKVWPGPLPSIHLTDVHRCRFRAASGAHEIQNQDILEALAELAKRNIEWMHIEKLYEFNGQPGFTLAQGE